MSISPTINKKSFFHNWNKFFKNFFVQWKVITILKYSWLLNKEPNDKKWHFVYKIILHAKVMCGLDSQIRRCFLMELIELVKDKSEII